MLVLTRRVGEGIVIAGDIQVTVEAIHGNRVRLGIAAPQSIRVDRREVAVRPGKFASDPASRKSPRRVGPKPPTRTDGELRCPPHRE